MQPKAPGVIPCAHCSRPGARQPCTPPGGTMRRERDQLAPDPVLCRESREPMGPKCHRWIRGELCYGTSVWPMSSWPATIAI